VLELVILGVAWDAAEVYIALGALAVSIYSLWQSGKANALSHQTDRRMIEIEEDRDKADAARDKANELEARKALVRAMLVDTDEYLFHGTLRLKNTGRGPSRNISVELDGIPLNDHPVVRQRPITIPDLGPTFPFDIQLLIPDEVDEEAVTQSEIVTLPSSAVVRWTDDSGQPGIHAWDLD
jgi:hypothetical protein